MRDFSDIRPIVVVIDTENNPKERIVIGAAIEDPANVFVLLVADAGAIAAGRRNVPENGSFALTVGSIEVVVKLPSGMSVELVGADEIGIDAFNRVGIGAERAEERVRGNLIDLVGAYFNAGPLAKFGHLAQHGLGDEGNHHYSLTALRGFL